MHWLIDYGIFLAEAITIVIAIIAAVAGVLAVAAKAKSRHKEELEIININEKFEQMAHKVRQETMEAKTYRKAEKAAKKAKKATQKNTSKADETRKLYVIDFEGDIKASAVTNLREEVTAVLSVAQATDEVLVRVDSRGGMVHTYGLAASQLQRIRDAKIPLTIAIDKIAASGGYMMACVGNKIIAAPFAIVGSIGVIAQLPNFHRLLKKNDIDFEQISAGEFKRTLTVFGENTKKNREKFQEEVDITHQLFKDFVSEHRPQVNINNVATGEHWFALKAFDLNLVDKIMTSDDYLLQASHSTDIFQIKYTIKEGLLAKTSFKMQQAIRQLLTH